MPLFEKSSVKTLIELRNKTLRKSCRTKVTQIDFLVILSDGSKIRNLSGVCGLSTNFTAILEKLFKFFRCVGGFFKKSPTFLFKLTFLLNQNLKKATYILLLNIDFFIRV